MFTGIVKDVGKIISVVKRGDGLRFSVKINSPDFADLAIDESVAINGACQTVVAVTGQAFEVDTVEETLKKTTLGSYKIGRRVNLERAIRPIDRMGGHIVQGHVDCVGQILSIEKQSASWKYKIRYESKFNPFIVPIGSIAVDGISLTVAEVSASVFTLAIIPYTFAHTTLAERLPGDAVNLEFDILGKYIAHQLQLNRGSALPYTTPESILTESRLKELGY
ncbi:riboflavin synthase, alpha subunit [Chloroherpeton thalassium ATCC 35110]|uniref:Riboflavin synthase n=1 Tax=Chloroherpeton thalassium (strain ATCC 35110 / GB-78) TaxID=517418 RepID=B3QVC9_CHLT3|nr:riboflavin synthase [Chloroherpeton thalassium]ACF14529.1 riboflavin synthase, alpha subunit [Chloroherpeton thalassium ATCC 35110]